MRRSFSNSITLLCIVYGTNKVSGRPCILIENVDPSDSGIDSALVWSTVPDPSMLACFPASASSAKISAAGALITRSTLTVLPSTAVRLANPKRHVAPSSLIPYNCPLDGAAGSGSGYPIKSLLERGRRAGSDNRTA
jgi:hypothetical protein